MCSPPCFAASLEVDAVGVVNQAHEAHVLLVCESRPELCRCGKAFDGLVRISPCPGIIPPRAAPSLSLPFCLVSVSAVCGLSAPFAVPLSLSLPTTTIPLSNAGPGGRRCSVGHKTSRSRPCRLPGGRVLRVRAAAQQGAPASGVSGHTEGVPQVKSVPLVYSSLL